MEALYQGCKGKVEGDDIFVKEELKKREASGDYVAEPKCDGIWAELRFTGEKIIILSRNSKEKEYKDIQGFINLFPRGTILVGELAYGSQESKKEVEELGHGFIRLFDIIAYGHDMFVEGHEGIKGLDYKMHIADDVTRREILSGYVNQHAQAGTTANETFVVIPSIRSGFCEMYDSEEEGIILKDRSVQHFYTGNKVKHWIKVKKKPTYDVILIGFDLSEAETKVDKPMAANIEVGMYFEITKEEYMDRQEKPTLDVLNTADSGYWGGKYYELRSCGKAAGMTHQWCEDLAQRFEDYEGKVFEITAYKQFKSGSFRHPSLVGIRDDKNTDECIYGA